MRNETQHFLDFVSFDNAIALARELGVSLKTLAKAMKLDVTDIPDDE